MYYDEIKAKGWWKFYRGLIDYPIWANSTLEQRVILITLLCLANHSSNSWEWNGKLYELEAGQFITSVKSIVDKCNCKNITTQKVRTALKRFEKLGFLTNKSTNKNRLITIVNWRKYQDYFDEDNRQTNRQITSNQLATNRQITTNNNEKNFNNVNNEKSSCRDSTYIPTREDVRKYVNYNNYTFDTDYFYNYYKARDWKIGKEPIKDFEALKSIMDNWQKKEGTVNTKPSTMPSTMPKNVFNSYGQKVYTQEAIDSIMKHKKEQEASNTDNGFTSIKELIRGYNKDE